MSEVTITVYYINLQDQAGRRKTLEKNLSEVLPHNISINRVEAIGESRIGALSIYGAIRATEKGCFQSHKKAVELSLADSNHALILEDDALLGPNTLSEIQNVCSYLENDFELIYTDACIPDITNMLALFFMRRQLKVEKFTKLINLKEINFAGATAYLLHKNFKRKYYDILNSYTELDVPYDLYIRQLIYDEKINGLLTFPFLTSLTDDSLVSQNQLDTDRLNNLAWDSFRKLMFIDSEDVIKYPLKGFEGLPAEFFDNQSIQFSELLKVLLSKNFNF